MSNGAAHPRVRAAVIVSAFCLVALGALLLFAPAEAGALFGESAPGPLLQLLGACLLGFGAMNWVIRDATLGGIYGKAVLVGNQTQFLIGALVLVKRALREGDAMSQALWALTGFYLLSMTLFGYLTFFNKGVPKR